jgi:hypothetical protein
VGILGDAMVLVMEFLVPRELFCVTFTCKQGSDEACYDDYGREKHHDDRRPRQTANGETPNFNNFNAVLIGNIQHFLSILCFQTKINKYKSRLAS